MRPLLVEIVPEVVESIICQDEREAANVYNWKLKYGFLRMTSSVRDSSPNPAIANSLEISVRFWDKGNLLHY